MADTNEFNNNVVSGVEHAKKSKGGLIAGITAGVLVVAVGGGFAAYATSDYVKNQVKLMVSSPENYYTWVNEKNTENFAKQVSEEYRTALDEMKNGQKGSVSLKYEPTDSAKDLFSDNFDETLDSDKQVIDIIKNITNISIGSTIDSNGSIMSGNAFIGLNDEKIVTMDMAVDSANMDVFFRISELTEQWLNVETDYIYGYSDDETLTAYEKFMKDPESLITPEELETEINKYANLWNECIADVKLEKKADIAISDINVNYTVASVEIDEAKANEIAEKFVTAVKEDEILKSIVVDKLSAVTADEYTSELDDILTELKEDSDLSSETVTLSTYIDPTGCIRGISVEVPDNNSMKFIIGKDGDEIRGEMYITEDGEDAFKGTLTATENDKKYTGSFDMVADDTTVSVEFTDLETVDEKKGYINGILTFVLPADTEIAPISVNFNSDGSSQQISADLDIDGTNYGKITLDISSENGAEPSLPDKSTAFVINDETDAELSDYIEQDKMEEFIKNLLTKIGFSSEEAAEGAKAIGEELYYSYDYDDYYTDWEDIDDYGDWDTDDKDIDIDTDIDDEQYLQESDPYADDMVMAENGQAYLFVIDNTFSSFYMGSMYDNLGYNATVADITGNGTYTVKVTADTDGYRNIMSDSKPDGIMMLGVEADGMENIENTVINIKSVKIDGKEIAVTGDSHSEIEDNSIFSIAYSDLENEYSIIDGSAVGEWTDIEVTFAVTGMK
ncbi:MAG: hypothetical protein K2O36_03300 [Ruminococcus sp.]|nr:hypothetical protein [Ruminococcus sp.]